MDEFCFSFSVSLFVSYWVTFSKDDVVLVVVRLPQTSVSQDVEIQTESVSYAEVGVQTDVIMDHLNEFSTQDLQDKSQMSRKIFLASVMKDDSSCKFYTGKFTRFSGTNLSCTSLVVQVNKLMF